MRCAELRRGVLIAVAGVLLSNATRAEDRVTIQRAGATGSMTLTGEIEDFTARRITLRIQEGTTRRSFPTDEVVAIETHQSDVHQRGLQELAAGNHAAAESLLAVAVEKEARQWVQQDLFADLVRCARRRGDRQAAGAYFARMIVQEPSSRHWEATPLVWAPEELGHELRTAAAEWLASSAEGVRLLGASILLLDESHADVARQTLDDLARTPDRHLQALARAQLWRLRLSAGDVSAPELDGWRQQVGSIPREIRGGPLYVLGRAAANRSDLEQAAADWLWLPLVYDDDEPLAARACVDAADALSRLGRNDEAATLYREVIERFDWSTAARDAEQRLGSLASEGAPDGG